MRNCCVNAALKSQGQGRVVPTVRQQTGTLLVPMVSSLKSPFFWQKQLLGKGKHRCLARVHRQGLDVLIHRGSVGLLEMLAHKILKHCPCFVPGQRGFEQKLVVLGQHRSWKKKRRRRILSDRCLAKKLHKNAPPGIWGRDASGQACKRLWARGSLGARSDSPDHIPLQNQRSWGNPLQVCVTQRSPSTKEQGASEKPHRMSALHTQSLAFQKAQEARR